MKCTDCKVGTEDSLARNIRKKWWFFSYKSKELVPYCREHLLQHFEQELVLFGHRLAVAHPCMEDKESAASIYVFETYSVIQKEWDIAVDRLRQALDGISGACMDCSGVAEVAYFGPEFIRFDEGSPQFILDSDNDPINLCKKCVLKKILPSLREFADSFREGLWCPDEEEGLYIPSDI